MEKKRLIGIGLLLYCLIFTLPLIASLKMYLRYGKSFSEIITDTIYYIRLYKIFFIVLAFFCIWLAYLIASIGLMKGKNWGRIVGVYSTGIMTIWSFGYWLIAIYNDIVHPSILSRSPLLGFDTFIGFVILIIPIGLPSLIFLILLTRPKVKEQFK